MLTQEQHATALRLLRAYEALDPQPGSRYAQRILELRTLLHEHGHWQPLTHADIQARVDAKRGAK